MLRAGVMQDHAVARSALERRRAGVNSPLLANVYLHRLDRCWQQRGPGVLVRCADDLLVMYHTRTEAEAALIALRTVMAELGLRLKDAHREQQPLVGPWSRGAGASRRLQAESCCPRARDAPG